MRSNFPSLSTTTTSEVDTQIQHGIHIVQGRFYGGEGGVGVYGRITEQAAWGGKDGKGEK